MQRENTKLMPDRSFEFISEDYLGLPDKL